MGADRLGRLRSCLAAPSHVKIRILLGRSSRNPYRGNRQLLHFCARVHPDHEAAVLGDVQSDGPCFPQLAARHRDVGFEARKLAPRVQKASETLRLIYTVDQRADHRPAQDDLSSH